MYEAQNPLFRSRRDGVLLNAGSRNPILRIFENPSADEVWIAMLALTPSDPVDSDGFVDPPDWVMAAVLWDRWRQYPRSMLQLESLIFSLKGADTTGEFNEVIGLAKTEVRHMFTFMASVGNQ